MILAHVFQHALDILGNWRGTEDYHVGIRLSGPDEAFRHGCYGGAELLNDRLGSAAAFAHIALLTPLETDIIRHLNVNACTEKAAQLRPMQSEQPFKDHEWRRLKWLCCGSSSMNGEVVSRDFDRITLTEFRRLRDQQIVLEG
jgi:hypothetical protein